MRKRDPSIAFLNKLIDELFHRYFDDPKACLLAIGVDTLLHQYFEMSLGLSRKEVVKRTVKYLPKVLERCINARLKNLRRDAS